MDIDWLNIFSKFYSLDDEHSNLTRISILRILLQCVRISKEAIEKILQSK